MVVLNSRTEDEQGRQIHPVLFNTAKDGSGTWYFALVDSDGQLILGAGTAAIGKLAANSGVDIGDVDVLSIAAGDNRIGTVSGVLKEVRVAQVIDASLGAYTAGDVVGADDCCTTLAIAWEFDVARIAGGYGEIIGAILINETENQAVQYDLILFNATPTGELRDNAANDNPLKADRSKWIGTIPFPFSIARGATVATTAQATPSTSGRLPMAFKCAAGVTKIYGVLVTNTIYTQDATDDIEITLLVEQY